MKLIDELTGFQLTGFQTTGNADGGWILMKMTVCHGTQSN